MFIKGEPEGSLGWNCAAFDSSDVYTTGTSHKTLTQIHTSKCRGNLGRIGVLYQWQCPGWDIVLCYCRMLLLGEARQAVQKYLSALFLANACKSTIISILISMKNFNENNQELF